MPSLSTFVGFIPQLAVYSFGVEVIGWMLKDSFQESNETLDESMWADWQNAKCRGLRYAQDFIQGKWAMEKGFGFVYISQGIINKLLKGEIKTIEEISTFQQAEIENNYNQSVYYIVFYNTQFDEDRKENLTLIDSIFIN